MLNNLLRDKCFKKLKELGLDNNPIYIDRLETELSVVSKLGFTNYFLVVEDVYSWAWKNNILPGSGRGSAAGSLILWLLDATALDPIKWDLPFSRFLNANRADPPDIDMDWPTDDRERVVTYLRNKYHKDCVALISTYGVMKPRSALRDLCRVTDKPLSFADEIANLIPPPIAGRPMTLKEAIAVEPKLSDEKYKEIVDLALEAEGTIRTRGVHAAGVIITDKPIYEYAPVCTDKEGNLVCQLDKKAAEKLGLIKFDFLALKTLTIIDTCLKLVKQNKNVNIHPYKDIPVDDNKVYDLFCAGKLEGVFQFEGSSALRDLTVALQPKTLDDLAVINALYRPGPIQAGYVNEYIARKSGKNEVTFIHSSVKPILNSTYGLFIFQEQVMRLSQVLANYTELQADELRKAIGRKVPELMAAEKDRFLKGCKEKGSITEAQASQLFKEIEGCADYLFNRSHAYCYSLIGYITAWLKVNYPAEFWAALLSNNLKSDKTTTYVTAMKEDEVYLLPPDVSNPSKNFKIIDKKILYGMSGIRDCNADLSKLLSNELKNGSWKSLEDLLRRTKLNKKVLIALAEVGALDSLIGRSKRASVVQQAEALITYRSDLEAYERRFTEIIERDKQREDAIKNGTKKMPALKPKERPTAPLLQDNITSELSLLTQQRLYAGTFLDKHPLELYKEYEIKDWKSHWSSELQDVHTGTEVLVLGVVTQIKQSNSKKMKQGITSLVLEDLTGLMNVTVYGNLAQKHQDLIAEGKLIQVNGKVSVFTTETEDGEVKTVKIVAKSLKLLPEPKTSHTINTVKEFFLSLSDGTKLVFSTTLTPTGVKTKGAEIVIDA